MKKRILLLAVCVCLMCGLTTAAGSVQENSLVSLSYLQGPYLQELQALINEQTAALGDTGRTEIERLDGLGQAWLDRLSGQPDDPWLESGRPLEQGGEREDSIILSAGSGLYWTSGTAKVTSGVLLDVTAGAELSIGGQLTALHRYVAAEEVAVMVTSRTAHWSAEGRWQTTSDGISVTELTFVDVKEGAWYYDAVAYAVDRGLFQGVSDTEFAPGSSMNRGMLATVLYRLAGRPEVTYAPVFTDVADGTWYAAGVVWSAENGVVKGFPNGTFAPMSELTRQQIAVMLFNYAGWAGCDTSGQGDLSAFPDGESTASWAKDAVSWAVSVGILQGSGGKLLPSESATRAQVATMLQRFEAWMA